MFLTQELRKVAFRSFLAKTVAKVPSLARKSFTGGLVAGTGAGAAAKAVRGRAPAPRVRGRAPASRNSMLSPNTPGVGTPRAAKWTALANRNSQRTGHGGRWNFTTGQSMPVTQSTQSGLTSGL